MGGVFVRENSSGFSMFTLGTRTLTDGEVSNPSLIGDSISISFAQSKFGVSRCDPNKDVIFSTFVNYFRSPVIDSVSAVSQ